VARNDRVVWSDADRTDPLAAIGLAESVRAALRVDNLNDIIVNSGIDVSGKSIEK
jgi:hypothetical protein